ncbi:MAG: pyruvate kinase alpha/beta domain-containing protein, partial [Bacteroidota bacterium]
TQSGRTIRNISAFRGAKPIYAQCFDKRVVRELALSYGVFADYMKPRETNPEFITESLHFLKENKHLEDDDLVVTVAGNFGTHHGASFIEVSTVKNLIQTNKVSVKSN